MREKPKTARQRGYWPELAGQKDPLRPQCKVTISLDKDIYEWLAGFVGKNSYFYSVEEAITTALRCMGAGENRMHLAYLVELVAEEKGLFVGEALFEGHADSEEKKRALNVLFWAMALIAYEKDASNLPENAEDRRILESLLAQVGCSMPEYGREESYADLADDSGSADIPEQDGKTRGDLDDDIPF